MMNTPDEIFGETIRLIRAMAHTDRLLDEARTSREAEVLVNRAQRMEFAEHALRQRMQAIQAGPEIGAITCPA